MATTDVDSSLAVDESSMPSSMVAVGAARPSLSPSHQRLAQNLSSQTRFKLPSWRVRAGRTVGYGRFLSVLQRIARQLNIDLNNLDEIVPPQPATRDSADLKVKSMMQTRDDWLARSSTPSMLAVRSFA